MNFFKKKKDKITLHCYTTDKMVYENAPIQSGANFFPEWWMNTSKINGGSATIKNCNAIQEYYKNAIIVPSWFQGKLTIHANNDSEGRGFSYSQSYATEGFEASHPTVQYPKIADSGYENFKIISPWRFKIEEDLQFTWTYPTYNFLKHPKQNLTLMPGVIFFYYQSEVNINYLVKYENDRESIINFEPLEPLVMLHPLTERKVEIENHLVTEDDLRALLPYEYMVNTWERSPLEIAKFYNLKKQVKNTIQNNKKQRCPFSHSHSQKRDNRYE